VGCLRHAQALPDLPTHRAVLGDRRRPDLIRGCRCRFVFAGMRAYATGVPALFVTGNTTGNTTLLSKSLSISLLSISLFPVFPVFPVILIKSFCRSTNSPRFFSEMFSLFFAGNTGIPEHWAYCHRFYRSRRPGTSSGFAGTNLF